MDTFDIFGFYEDDEGRHPTYSRPRKYDDRRARSHAEMADGQFGEKEAAEEGLESRERMSMGDIY
jgi:hypothetical protein